MNGPDADAVGVGVPYITIAPPEPERVCPDATGVGAITTEGTGGGAREGTAREVSGASAGDGRDVNTAGAGA